VSRCRLTILENDCVSARCRGTPWKRNVGVPVAGIRLRDFKNQSSHRYGIATDWSEKDGSGSSSSQCLLSLQCLAISIGRQSRRSPMVGGRVRSVSLLYVTSMVSSGAAAHSKDSPVEGRRREWTCNCCPQSAARTQQALEQFALFAGLRGSVAAEPGADVYWQRQGGSERERDGSGRINVFSIDYCTTCIHKHLSLLCRVCCLRDCMRAPILTIDRNRNVAVR
jgi:hypothetical protein